METRTPRRIDTTRWTLAETAIGNAMDAVEAMPADVRLTNAVVLLGQARDAVADFVDGVPADPGPTCWRCKARPGVVVYPIGVAAKNHECIECAGETLARTRVMLEQISDAATEDLPILPKIMNRVEFVRECVKLQREIGAGTLRPFYREATNA